MKIARDSVKEIDSGSEGLSKWMFRSPSTRKWLYLRTRGEIASLMDFRKLPAGPGGLYIRTPAKD